jgi:hypothetical protein
MNTGTENSWAALSIGQWYGTPLAASTSTAVSKHFKPAQADEGFDVFIFTGSLFSSSHFLAQLAFILNSQETAIITFLILKRT